MKKFFAIAVLAVLFTMSAWAQYGPGGNNDDQGSQEYNIYVICPIQVNPDNGTVDLGTIIPGQTKTGGFTNPYAVFTVTGNAGESFTATFNLTTSGQYTGASTGAVDITQHKWQEYDGTTWNNWGGGSAKALIGGTGNQCDASRDVRCVVEQVKATNDATSGTWKFPVSMTATYFGV